MRRTGRAAFLAVLIVISLLNVSASADDIEVNAHVDKNIVSLNDQVVLTIEVSGTMRNVPTPTLPPDLDSAFSVYSAGTSTNMSWVNGSMSSSRSWNYRLLPKNVGTFTVGAAKVEFGGAEYSTDPIEIQVVEGQAPQSSAEPEERPSTGVDSGGSDVFITTSVDKKRAFVGEQVTLSFKLYRRVDLWEQPNYEPPELTGFWVVDIPDREEYYENVKGIRYRVLEIKTALFGTSAGEATVGPAKLTYREQSGPSSFFFSRPGRLRALTTDPISVEIIALPAGKPEGFGGAVGSYTLATSLDTNAVDQWKPVTLKMTVSGRGNLRTVPDPVLPDLPEFRVYESGTSTNTSTTGGVVYGKKTYEYVLIPQTPGEKTIPGIRLPFFDPAKGTYDVARAGDLALSVAAAPEGDTGPDIQARTAISRLGQDIRYIHESSRVEPASPPIQRRASFLVLQLVPLAALGLAVSVSRRRERFAREDGLARFVKAPARARRELKAAREAATAGDAASVCSYVSRAVVDFIGARLKVGARGMTLDELARALHAAGADDALIERVRAVLGECDLGRFAGDFGRVEAERLLEHADACLREIEGLSAKRRR